MNILKPITLYKGGATIVNVDLTEFDLRGGKLILSIRERIGAKAIFEKELTESEIVSVIFPMEFTKKLSPNKNYIYDFMWDLDGQRIPQSEATRVNVIDTAGGINYAKKPND